MDNSREYNAWRTTSVNASLFDFDKAESIMPNGHCVVVCVTSEDPDDGFKPTGGKVQELESCCMVSDYVGYLKKGHTPPKHISLINSQVSFNIEGSKYTIDLHLKVGSSCAPRLPEQDDVYQEKSHSY
ncbi:hypothetical protein Tco_0858701 [Tanacetum coccineum]|uniref:Uncharacterized protein n=1 Tax=Tanacetum coccineum TaxID=301880 RepID=A0ABQ5BBQ7_9ASTR